MPVEREQQDRKNCPSKSANHASEQFFIEHFRVTDSGYMECFELRFIFRI